MYYTAATILPALSQREAEERESSKVVLLYMQSRLYKVIYVTFDYNTLQADLQNPPKQVSEIVSWFSGDPPQFIVKINKFEHK